VKKLVLVLLGLAVAISLAACGSPASKTPARPSVSLTASSSPAALFCTVLKNDASKLPTAPEWWPALNPLQALQALIDQGVTPNDLAAAVGLSATAQALTTDDGLAPPEIEPAVKTLLTFANGMDFNLTDPVGKNLDVNVVSPASSKIVGYCRSHGVTISVDLPPEPGIGG
jgi:hypothetical protein